MKKLLFVLAIAGLMIQGVWSEEPYDPLNKVWNFSETVFEKGTTKKVYFFNGFDFAKYQSTHPSLIELNEYERDFIRNDSKGGRYSILGYSQGGLRALGYIKQLSQNGGDPNAIDAVITTSAIDQGLPMLENNLGFFKSWVREKINILGNGIVATGTVAPIADIVGLFFRNQYSNLVNDNLGLIYDLLPEAYHFYLDIYKGADIPQQIKDMMPRSPYISSNVVEKKDTPYRVQTGQRTIFEWRWQTLFWGIQVPYPHWRTEPVYSYFTATETIPQFDSNVPVGFIVGTNSNTLSMLDEKDSDENENALRRNHQQVVDKFQFAKNLHTGKCWILGLGLITGSLAYIDDLEKAAHFLNNIDAELNGLKRSPENDGLVAVSSQYLPQTSFKDPVSGIEKKLTVLGNIPDGYFRIPDTHNNMGSNNTDVIVTTREWILKGEEKRAEQRANGIIPHN